MSTKNLRTVDDTEPGDPDAPTSEHPLYVGLLRALALREARASVALDRDDRVQTVALEEPAMNDSNDSNDSTVLPAFVAPPAVTIRVTYRDPAPNDVEEVTVSWDEGTYSPGVSDLVPIIDALRRPVYDIAEEV